MKKTRRVKGNKFDFFCFISYENRKPLLCTITQNHFSKFCGWHASSTRKRKKRCIEVDHTIPRLGSLAGKELSGGGFSG